MFFSNKIKPFLEVFVHDLKNRLASVKFSISLLKNPNISENDKSKLIDKALLSTESAIDMLKDFLDLERYKKEKFLKNEKFDLKSLIKEIIQELQAEIEAKAITVNVNFPNYPMFIKANKKWLKKALLNIIQNAVKYNKFEGKILIRSENAKNGYFLIIRDTGKGIKESEKQKIFKKFHTSDEETGSGIGLYMSRKVIESIGGKITFDSEENIGTAFYIFLPKISKKIRIRRLALTLSGFIIIGIFIYDYYFCLFPQKITVQKSDNLIIYKLQNGVVAIAKTNDYIKITAKRNLFATRFKTKFFLKKSDIQLNTNNQPIKVIANGITLKNYGTKFETITDNKIFATSVYKGKISAADKMVEKDEGIIKTGKSFKIKPLPLKVTELRVVKQKNGDVTLYWNSSYKRFKILLSVSEKFDKAPMFEYYTKKTSFKIDSVPDGMWFASIQSENDNLYSLPSIIKFLFLKNYIKAKKEYDVNNLILANMYVDKSLKTINKATYLPYALKTEILLKEKKYKEALEYAKTTYELKKNPKTLSILAKAYYYSKNYKQAIKLAKKLPNSLEKFKILGNSYFYLKNYNKAKEYLFKTLELLPNDKESMKKLLKIFKAQNNKFMIHIFENKILKGE
ncbi:ATP-binding protein [Caminibacter sp.]